MMTDEPQIKTHGHTLPTHVALALGDLTTDGNAPHVFALADIAPSGRFAQTWAALVDSKLAVVPQGNPPRFTPLDDRTQIEIVEGVGSSRLRVVHDGKLAEELRYSPRQAKRFSRLLHCAENRIKGDGDIALPRTEIHDDDHVTTGDRTAHRKRQKQVLWRLLGYLLRHRTEAAIGFGAAAMVTLLMMVPPLLTKHLINDVLTASDRQQPELLWPLIGLLAAAITLRVFFQYLRLSRMARVGEWIQHDLRSETFAHLQSLSLAYYSKKPTGQLINRIAHDSDRVWDFIAFGIVNVFTSALMVTGIAIILFSQDPLLAALTMAPIPLGIVLTYFHTISMRRVLFRLWAKWSRMTSVLSDVIPGARVVKAFTQEGREVGRFDERSQAVVDEAMNQHREWTTYWPKLSLLLSLGTVIIWSVAGPRVVRGSFDLGSFVMFLGYMWMFYGPIEELGVMNRVFQRATTSAHRIFEILDTPPAITSKRDPVRQPHFRGAITFENVSFSYDGIKRVLQDVSFHVEPGEMIGLAGPSGGGKTTLVNLICRFYDPIDGRVLIDGVDVRDYDLHELRQQIGVVLQEPYLFHGTVAQNIAYGRPDAPSDDLIEAARAANAHDFVVGFPDGYDTLVGERGQTVSGGERQRLSIARAVLNDPRMLILDEATSSVDSKTEMNIQQAIDRLVHGRTTFAIAHRLSTLRRANRLFILDKGKLVEQGTHDELMRIDNGVYAGLHKTQTDLHAIFAV